MRVCVCVCVLHLQLPRHPAGNEQTAVIDGVKHVCAWFRLDLWQISCEYCTLAALTAGTDTGPSLLLCFTHCSWPDGSIGWVVSKYDDGTY